MSIVLGEGMMKPAVLICLAVSFVVVIFASPGFAGDWQEFPVSPWDDDQTLPNVYGTKVVWQEYVFDEGTGQWDWDVYGVDLAYDPAEFFSVSAMIASDQENAAIWEDKVVWQDNRQGNWAVYIADVYDLTGSREISIAETQGVNHWNPAISGNTVVWQEDSAGENDLDIWGTNIIDPNNIVHYSFAFFLNNQQMPAVYRNRVVWEDDVPDDWGIRSADIWLRNQPTDDAVSQGEGIDEQQNPAIWGNIVVWQDYREGNWDIRAADISNPDLPVEFPVSQAPLLQSNPDVGDNLIVWQDYRNDNDWDIYGYNLTTGREFQITDDDADQINPAVSGNLVVWQDYRDGYPQVYAAELAGIEVARCNVRPAGDTNNDCVLDLRDLAGIAADWLTCGLDIAQACWN